MEEGIFDILNTSVDAGGLFNNLDEKFHIVEKFYYSPYDVQKEQIEDLEKFVLFQHSIVNELDYSIARNRSFILILLDLCERHAMYSCIPHLVGIVQAHDICLNCRIKAGLKFIYPKPGTNAELVDRLPEICELLETAYEQEEDNEYVIRITLLNYFDHVFYNTNQTYASKLLSDYSAIKESLSFVDGLSIIDELNPSDGETAHNRIQSYISTLHAGSETVSIPNEENRSFLIEEDTEYSRALQSLSANFHEVRQYCVRHTDGNLRGRGVTMLSTENEMFEYIKRYGRMHYAKLESAFELPFPQSFSQRLTVIDWGCGQALATMAFIEKYGNLCVDKIVLIEPSEIVLKRAALHCRKYAPDAQIRTVNKKLDDLSVDDLNIDNSNVTVNLFSNILDIDDYNPCKLKAFVRSVCSTGDYFVCVSPHIDEVKTEKIDSFCRFFNDIPSFRFYHDKLNSKRDTFWACNNSYKREFSGHGSYENCNPSNGNGCLNRWTRVLKVFSI